MIRRVAQVGGSGAVAVGSALVGAALSLVVLAGCGQVPADDSATPPPTPTGSLATTASPGASSTAEEDTSFTFDDIASYPNGVEVEIAGSSARKISSGMTGAESTNGELVVVSVLIRNDTDTDLDATRALVTATYGPDDAEAGIVTDPTGELTNIFLGQITPGAEDTAGYGFAIPFAALNHVRITVDLADDIHEPVSFTGSVVRER